MNGVRERALLKESAHSILGLCCLHNQTKGKEHEQIQKIITHDLALRISHRVGAKISWKGALVGILLKNPSGKKTKVKKTISDVSLGHQNRVLAILAREIFRHFLLICAVLENDNGSRK